MHRLAGEFFEIKFFILRIFVAHLIPPLQHVLDYIRLFEVGRAGELVGDLEVLHDEQPVRHADKFGHLLAYEKNCLALFLHITASINIF